MIIKPNITLFQDYTLHHYKILESTNDKAIELAKRGINHGTVILADSQTSARGRNNKSWQAPCGNLYFSIIIRNNSHKMAELSFITALSIGKTLEELLNKITNIKVTIQYKWPNDVLINKNKISGILLERHSTNSQSNVGWLVIGVGVNMHKSPNYATSISHYTTHYQHLTNLQLLQRIIANFKILEKHWLENGFNQIKSIWMKQAINIGNEITINIKNKHYTGIFIGIDLEGNIILKANDNSLLSFNSGEVF